MDELMQDVAEHKLRAVVGPRDIPFCTIFLVFMIFACHCAVLWGNMQTAAGMGTIGTSTKGWSGVGLQLSKSFGKDLDLTMKSLTTMLTEAINHTVHAQGLLHTVVGLMGHATHTAIHHNASAAMLLLQAHGFADNKSAPLGGLPGMVVKSVDMVLDMLMKKLVSLLHTLMKALKPALEQVGKFIIKFGLKVQQIIESFSVTLDMVQKIFDQVMASMSNKGDNEARLLFNTFHIMDIKNTGQITAQDLHDVSKLYTVPALQGSKADELVKKYDKDNSGGLEMDEYKKFVQDKSLPDVMSVVIRSFAKKLSQVAGQVGGSKFRGEISQDVVDYFELMVLKNQTKVAWVSDALTNASLPMAFTADVMVNMALMVDNPNSDAKVVGIPMGSVVIPEMLRLHPKYTAKCIDLLSNTTFWTTEGFDPADHAVVIQRVTEWATKATQATQANKTAFVDAPDHEEASMLLKKQGLDDQSTMLMKRRLLDIIPISARKIAEKNMREHQDAFEEKYLAHHDSLYSNELSQHLLLNLLGGETRTAADAHSNPATRMVKTGIPAAPETLQFAKWLSWNASDTADRFQHQAFAFQKTSSNAVDSFATQIQGMVKKIQSFIKMMRTYSTPEGIKLLEKKVEDFAVNATEDVIKIVKKSVGHLIKANAPALAAGLHKAVASAGMALGKAIAGAITSPLGQALAPIIADILRKLVPSKSASGKLGSAISKILTGDLGDITGEMLGKEIAHLLDGLIKSAISGVTKMLNPKAGGSSLLEMPTENVFQSVNLTAAGSGDSALLEALENDLGQALRQAQDVVQSELYRIEEDRSRGINIPGPLEVSLAEANLGYDLESDEELSGVWTQLTNMVNSLTHVVPQANKAMLFARKEVNRLAKGLDSIFTGFGHSGPPIFSTIESLFQVAWSLYFCVVMVLPLTLLYYAFWAGGFVGGAGTIKDQAQLKAEEEEENETPVWKKLLCCCCTFCSCIGHGHDYTMCFWSVCILFQIVALVMFLLSFVLCILAAVKMFLAAGCAQIYILGDPSICGTTLQNLRSFLDSFIPGVEPSEMPGFCQDKNLLTCHTIGPELMASGITCAAGSFVASILTFQLLIEAATLHQRAVQRNYIAKHIVSLTLDKPS